MIIAVDFDGTCVTHEFPKIGKPIGAAPVLKKLVDKGHKIILWTMRSHPDTDYFVHGLPAEDYLNDAKQWFALNEIPLYGVNKNPDQKSWTSSPKVYAHLYIDDAALGIPLIVPGEEHVAPYVDWHEVEKILIKRGIL